MVRGTTMVVLALLMGCSPDSPPLFFPDSGPFFDPRIFDTPPFDAPVEDTTLEHFNDGLALVGAFGWGFGLGLQAVSTGGVPSGTEARELVATALEGGRLVEDAACTQVEWTAARVAELTLIDCTLALTGEPLSGVVTLELAGSPTLHVTFDGLTAGDLVTDGGVRVRPANDFMGGASVEAALSYFDGATSVSLAVRSTYVTRYVGTENVSIQPQGTWIGGRRGNNFTGDLSWLPGDCLPSGNALFFDGAPFNMPMQVFFTPDVPVTGVTVVPGVSLRACR